MSSSPARAVERVPLIRVLMTGIAGIDCVITPTAVGGIPGPGSIRNPVTKLTSAQSCVPENSTAAVHSLMSRMGTSPQEYAKTQAICGRIRNCGCKRASITLNADLVREDLMLDIGKDIHSLSDFKRNTSEFLDQMRDSGHPLVLTINGKAEIVVQDAASYQKLLDRMDQLEALEGIKRGLADVLAGSVTPLRKFEKEFRSKRGLHSRPR